MIIWIGSYPKSGNTYIRSFLSAYYFSEDGKVNFDLLKNMYLNSKYEKEWDLSKASLKCLLMQKLVINGAPPVYEIANTPLSFSDTRHLSNTPLMHFNFSFISDLGQIIRTDDKPQTLSTYGIDIDKIKPIAASICFTRTVPIGMSHMFSLDWDGYCLPKLLTF